MPETIESPYPDTFPGSITLPDALTWAQFVAVDIGLFESRGVANVVGAAACIGAVNAIVEWHIDGLPEKPTPESIFMKKDADGKRIPARVTKGFFNWVQNQVARLYSAEKEVPKG